MKYEFTTLRGFISEKDITIPPRLKIDDSYYDLFINWIGARRSVLTGFPP